VAQVIKLQNIQKENSATVINKSLFIKAFGFLMKINIAINDVGIKAIK
jgi:hypothetical protein